MFAGKQHNIQYAERQVFRRPITAYESKPEVAKDI